MDSGRGCGYVPEGYLLLDRVWQPGDCCREPRVLTEAMTEARVWLRQANQDEFDEWLPRTEADYATFIAESGAMPAEQAAEKARHDIARPQCARPEHRRARPVRGPGLRDDEFADAQGAIADAASAKRN